MYKDGMYMTSHLCANTLQHYCNWRIYMYESLWFVSSARTFCVTCHFYLFGNQGCWFPGTALGMYVRFSLREKQLKNVLNQYCFLGITRNWIDSIGLVLLHTNNLKCSWGHIIFPWGGNIFRAFVSISILNGAQLSKEWLGSKINRFYA